MEYVDPKELGDVVTFCFSYFFTSSLPLLLLFFFLKGAIYPVIICLEAFFPLLFPSCLP